MFLKLFRLSQKAVQFTKMFSLVADTVQYFHDEGVKRGVFTDDKTEINKNAD